MEFRQQKTLQVLIERPAIKHLSLKCTLEAHLRCLLANLDIQIIHPPHHSDYDRQTLIWNERRAGSRMRLSYRPDRLGCRIVALVPTL